MTEHLFYTLESRQSMPIYRHSFKNVDRSSKYRYISDLQSYSAVSYTGLHVVLCKWEKNSVV